MPECLLGVLTREWTSTWWAIGLRALRLPEDHGIEVVSGLPFDHARNHVCRLALEREYDWVFFLDDDVIPPPDAFELLTSHGHPVVSGLYYRRVGPTLPVMYHEMHDKPAHAGSVPRNSLVKVDAVGAGCLVIHRSILKAIEPPWFEWQMDRTDLPSRDQVSEDIAFSRKIVERGQAIYVDTGVSCSHVGFGEAREGSFTPLSRGGIDLPTTTHRLNLKEHARS